MGEVARIADEGTPVPVVDSAFAGVAPMPPYVLLSLVGPAIALHNNETLYRAFPDRFYVSENLRRVVEARKAELLRRRRRDRPGGRRPAAACRRPRS